MIALYFPRPFGTMALGLAPDYDWGPAPPRMDVLNRPHAFPSRGDVLVYQGQRGAPEMEMWFPSQVDHFPAAAYLGVVNLDNVAPGPEMPPWGNSEQWKWVLHNPRPFVWPMRGYVPELRSPGPHWVCRSRDMEKRVHLANRYYPNGLDRDDHTWIGERYGVLLDTEESAWTAEKRAVEEWFANTRQERTL